MHYSIRRSNGGNNKQGFALVATISVMVLLVMIALAMLSLSTLELRNSQQSSHRAEARANARLALMQALSELQKHTGPDQRVTARAAILETGTTTVANRNWLGVWDTTVASNDLDWPVIGKAPSSGNNTTPYTRPGAYIDLRHSQADLANDAWKTKLRRSWLVSKRGDTIDFTQPLSDSDSNVVEMIGEGTLGKGLNSADFQRERVLVQKVDVDDKGAYAWYIADNNQKASVDPLTDVDNVDVAFEASPRANPALVELNGGEPFARFTEDALKHQGKLITYGTAPLTQSAKDQIATALKERYHHFTIYSPGLFTDTMLGGLRKDLTPLLLAKNGSEIINFTEPSGSSARTFSSSYPIIPGADHGVLGPSFGALRNWALHAHSPSTDAETTAPSSVVRMRPTTHWPHGISDGATMDAAKWAESAPKIHPIMTDSRWHYYFSHHNKRIRTHIVPRVCLWNPYNKELKTPALTVMMPNPFYDVENGIHFIPDENYVDELKEKHKDDGTHPFSRWIKKKNYIDGDGDNIAVYKMLTNPFPNARFLAFKLEPVTIKAGECHVFSPKVTNSSLQASGVKLQLYQSDEISANTLSSDSTQGTDHFYYDSASTRKYEVQVSSSSEKTLTDENLNELDFSKILDYQPELSMSKDGKVENFPFILKVGTSSSLEKLYTSEAHPTLQLINNAAGGAHATTSFSIAGYLWGSAKQEDNSFGPLQTFAEAPLKDAPDTHQFGAKMLWLNELSAEANEPPMRRGTKSKTRWVPDHMAFNPCPIANWNVRAQLQTRSPASQCAERFYLNSLGAWLLQFVPHSPQNFNDQPSLNPSGDAFVKNPFGAANDFPFSQRVILFDLPSEDYGVISIAKLRHAMLSPYSWTPTYIVGHSLRDLHAPADASAHEIAVSDYSNSFPSTRWDYLLGGYKAASIDHGPEAENVDSQGLLQIGSEAVTRKLDEGTLSSKNEVLAYDIAYEVNHNLWDRFFISGMPLSLDTQSLNWHPMSDKPLWNRRYQFNFDGGMSLNEAIAEFTSSDALNTAFWKNAQVIKNRAAFNVNSTSVDAWVAFLSGTLGIKRPLESGELDGSQVSFARHSNPYKASDTADADPDRSGAWVGARKLTDDEIRDLAMNIVIEVKKRGPFVSIADFVNRRLTDADDETSRMGTLEAAIKASGLNREFDSNEEYLSTAVIRGSDPRSEDNNHDDFKAGYRLNATSTSQPSSQAWGLPGYLTQGDLLEPLAPAISVRGDTFTIRAYGESSKNGVIMAQAWLEVTVERGSRYVNPANDDASGITGNEPSDVDLIINQGTGNYMQGNLTEINKQFGRKLVIKSIRWLSPKEI